MIKLNFPDFEFKLKKIGHAGTLDPLAEGVLPIAIGEATKSIPYLAEAKKNYLCFWFAVSLWKYFK